MTFRFLTWFARERFCNYAEIVRGMILFCEIPLRSLMKSKVFNCCARFFNFMEMKAEESEPRLRLCLCEEI